MLIVRSFNINKSNTLLNNKNKISGGIVGGTIINGKFKKGDEIYIYPGIINLNKDPHMGSSVTEQGVKVKNESLHTNR